MNFSTKVSGKGYGSRRWGPNEQVADVSVDGGQRLVPLERPGGTLPCDASMAGNADACEAALRPESDESVL